jgi:hypothetical protein
MAKVRFEITQELMRQVVAEANFLWPGQGMLAVRRLVRDSLRRLCRYCSGDGRARDRNG